MNSVQNFGNLIGARKRRRLPFMTKLINSVKSLKTQTVRRKTWNLPSVAK